MKKVHTTLLVLENLSRKKVYTVNTNTTKNILRSNLIGGRNCRVQVQSLTDLNLNPKLKLNLTTLHQDWHHCFYLLKVLIIRNIRSSWSLIYLQAKVKVLRAL